MTIGNYMRNKLFKLLFKKEYLALNDSIDYIDTLDKGNNQLHIKISSLNERIKLMQDIIDSRKLGTCSFCGIEVNQVILQTGVDLVEGKKIFKLMTYCKEVELLKLINDKNFNKFGGEYEGHPYSTQPTVYHGK